LPRPITSLLGNILDCVSGPLCAVAVDPVLLL
jgi:hypothetical protein